MASKIQSDRFLETLEVTKVTEMLQVTRTIYKISIWKPRKSGHISEIDIRKVDHSSGDQ